MPETQPRLKREDIARLGETIYHQQILPTLKPEDHGKFIAIEVEAGNFEMDRDDYTAVKRVHARIPGAQVWLVRVGYPAAHRLRSWR